MCELIKETIETFTYRSAIHSIETDLPKSLRAYGDQGKITNVIAILVENAIKWSIDGGRISISCAEPEDGGVMVSVTDEGIGIEDDLIDKIFDPLTMLEKPDRPGIKGGLNVVKTVVELHGGSIRAESEGENKGASITFTIPPGDNNHA